MLAYAVYHLPNILTGDLTRNQSTDVYKIHRLPMPNFFIANLCKKVRQKAKLSTLKLQEIDPWRDWQTRLTTLILNLKANIQREKDPWAMASVQNHSCTQKGKQARHWKL